MDKIKALIVQLSEEECKEFKAFIHRKKTLVKRKDLLLFNLMRETSLSKPDKYCKAIYGEKGTINNYHGLRKRLFKHLISFIVLRRMDDDNTGASLLMGQVSLVRYLLDQGQDEMAWYYLMKSENLAIQTQQYDLLNGIYRLQIENAESEYAAPLKRIIQNKKKYKKLADIEEAAGLALSIIKQRLNEVKYDAKWLDFDQIITETLSEFELTEIAFNNPRHFFQILSILRSAILAKKEFYAFEPFVMSNYKNLVAANLFTKENHFYRLSILYILCHVLYRNRKFNEAMNYLKAFKQDLHAFNAIYFRRFYIRFVSLLAATNSYLGHAAEAIKLIENALVTTKNLKEPERLGLLLNLGLYYFQLGDIKQANQTEVRMGHTDKWYEKKMGREWVMKKELMALIIQYELGNDEIVINRIMAIKRKFGDMFANPLYQRVQLYLDLIYKIQIEPSMLTSQTFEGEIMTQLVQHPPEEEDLQAMTFYSWLKAKFHRKDFYETLLETVKSDV